MKIRKLNRRKFITSVLLAAGGAIVGSVATYLGLQTQPQGEFAGAKGHATSTTSQALRPNVQLRPVTNNVPPWEEGNRGPIQTSGRYAPADVDPEIPPNDEIILFIHGHMSRAEEALDIIPKLHTVGQQSGKRYTVIAFDQPTSGYSSMVDHTVVSAAMGQKDDGDFNTDPFSSSPAKYPIVDFLEDFIIDFVSALDKVVPIKNRNITVIGGSLGGCMGLRLGRRTDQTWIKRIVAWSPASVWTSWNHDLAKGPLALGTSQGRWRADPPPAPENASRRKEYFDQAFGPPYPGAPSQADQWYRNGWDCKGAYILSSHNERQEMYNQLFRRWHWRLGAELLIFSIQDTQAPQANGQPRYKLIAIPTLLAAGDQDNYDAIPGSHWLNIYDRSRDVANGMTNTPGRALWFLNTGHSIDNEYPQTFAQQIVNFIINTPGLMIAQNQNTIQPPAETCNSPVPLFQSSYEAAAYVPMVTEPNGEGRLVKSLRDVAASHDPVFALGNSIRSFYHGDTVMGNAFADLAVTGRRSYASFLQKQQILGAGETQLENELETLLANASWWGTDWNTLDFAKVNSSRTTALRRAYLTAWAIRETIDTYEDGTKTWGARARNEIHTSKQTWMAVSCEDDPPHRPVNMPSSTPWPSYDLPVTCHGLVIQTRYLVASP